MVLYCQNPCGQGSIESVPHIGVLGYLDRMLCNIAGDLDREKGTWREGEGTVAKLQRVPTHGRPAGNASVRDMSLFNRRGISSKTLPCWLPRTFKFSAMCGCVCSCACVCLCVCFVLRVGSPQSITCRRQSEQKCVCVCVYCARVCMCCFSC